jgi:hypothetical protein
MVNYYSDPHGNDISMRAVVSFPLELIWMTTITPLCPVSLILPRSSFEKDISELAGRFRRVPTNGEGVVDPSE